MIFSAESGSFDKDQHTEAFVRAVKEKGSLPYYMVQCLPFGPPRVGKTCLYHCLLDKPPPGVPSTCDTPGTGSLSTDVLSERKMIQVKIDIKSKKDQAEMIVAESGKWSEVTSLQEEIAIYLKSIEQQRKLAVSSETISLKKTSEPLQSSTGALSSLPSKDSNGQSKDENKNDFPLFNSVRPQIPVSTTLDEAVIRAITDNVSGRKVDMGKVQALLEKSMTIFYTDTEGQPEFHEVLPALVAGPTMFLLVFNLLKSLDSLYRVSYECSSNQYEVYNSSFSVKDVLMQCFSSILSHHDAQSRDVSKQKSNFHQMDKLSPPPTSVLVVGTHSDLVSSSDVLKADKEIQHILGDKAIVEYFNENELVIPIDNYKDDDGSKVREVIERVLKRKRKGTSPYKIKIPVHWLGLELSLRQKKCSSVSFSECSELARKFNIDDEELTSCLWFLHYKTGTIRYYSSVEELKDTVITKPNVLFAAVTEFIMSTFTLEHVDKKVCTDFKALGLFNSEEVDFIFNRHKERLGITYTQLMALLSHLNILVPAHDEKFDFFLPCALAHAPESADTESAASHYSLSIIFNKGFVPKGCFSGLLGSLCKEGWRITYADSKPQLYRNKAILSVELKESEHSIDCTITATVSNIEFSIQYQTDSVFLCIQNIVKRSMQNVCTKLQYVEMWSFSITCKHPDCASMDFHFASVDKEEKNAICNSNRQYKLQGTQVYWIHSKYNLIIHTTSIVALINDYRIMDAHYVSVPEYQVMQ